MFEEEVETKISLLNTFNQTILRETLVVPEKYVLKDLNESKGLARLVELWNQFTQTNFLRRTKWI